MLQVQFAFPIPPVVVYNPEKLEIYKLVVFLFFLLKLSSDKSINLLGKP